MILLFFLTDKEAPDLQCPEDISLQVFTGNTSVRVYWDEPMVSDNSEGVVHVTSFHKSGDLFQFGSTEVDYIASDESGNINGCKFTVTIEGKNNLCDKNHTNNNVK